MSIQTDTPTFMSISQMTAEKSPENLILTKGYYWCAILSNAAKFVLDMHYVETNS